jgi:hypothetical protein
MTWKSFNVHEQPVKAMGERLTRVEQLCSYEVSCYTIKNYEGGEFGDAVFRARRRLSSRL